MMSDPHDRRLDHGLPVALGERYRRRTSASGTVTVAEDGQRALVTIPTGARIAIHRVHGVDLAETFDQQSAARLMWLHALEPLRVAGEAFMAGADHLTPFLLAGWRSAADHLRRQDTLPTLPSSPDHAAASRLRACLEAGEYVDDPELRTQIRQVGDATVEWILDEATYRANNHGLMSSISLLWWHAAVERVEGADRARGPALRRILDLARTAFDAHGYCNENTIGYHNFNLTCYDEVLEIQDAERIDETIESDLRPILTKARRALALTLLPDGTVPTIGDSPRYVVRTVEPEDAPSTFPESGLAVYKDGGLYVSLVCGSRSEIHKHSDDGSMTVHLDGRPLIVDTGSYLYDRSDPYRAVIESPAGHSMTVPAQIDGRMRRPLVLEHPDYWARLGACGRLEDGSYLMTAALGLGDRLRVSRSIRIYDAEWIVVTDRVRFADETLAPDSVQRWILGPELSAQRLAHGHWTATGSTADAPGVTLLALGHTGEELYFGETEAPHRGWYSEQYHQKTPVFGLDLHARGARHVYRTLLRVGRDPLVDPAQAPTTVLERLYA